MEGHAESTQESRLEEPDAPRGGDWSGSWNRWREAKSKWRVLYFGFMTVMLAAPLLALLWGGPSWGRPAALACGLIWLFCGYWGGFGAYSLTFYSLALLGLMAQYFWLSYPGKPH